MMVGYSDASEHAFVTSPGHAYSRFRRAQQGPERDIEEGEGHYRDPPNPPTKGATRVLTPYRTYTTLRDVTSRFARRLHPCGGFAYRPFPE
jgi:hypothetical protein